LVKMACGSGDMLADRQTHTDVVNTILCYLSRGWRNHSLLCPWSCTENYEL